MAFSLHIKHFYLVYLELQTEMLAAGCLSELLYKLPI